MTTLQTVELGVLGTLQVRQYGLPVAIPGAKPRAILTMLGLHGGGVVSADTLVELLWGDDPPRTAAKALQTHISSLRRTLGDGFVLTEGAGWVLNTTETDATRYKLAARLGRDAVAAGDPSQAIARFDEALALWRGVPELPDGPRGASEKTRWIESHAALVEDRADALLATGRAAEIIGELEAAVADAPLRERRWGQLMLALYRAGRQGEALGAYQRARSLLADELGVDPGPELRRLEGAIVTQDAALEVPVSQQLSAVTRAVTFLLTDIEGSTAAWEADADAMAAALARHDEIVEQVVTSRGGRLIKTRGEGDATFSVFDRPSAAAAAAIELQEAISHEPWALGEPMRIRVALHTGEVELRDGDYFGRAVNRAARLRSLAAGGQILCSGATAELVIDSLRDDVVLVDLGTRQLKNLARPEHVFELRLDTADESRTPTPDATMERPVLPAVLAGPGPFVGRGRELEQLLSIWQTTLAAGTRAVMIAGEPGVGKTRLAGEWSRQAYEGGAVVLYGRCDEDLGAPYQPFAEALRALAPCLGASRIRGLRGAEALLPLVPGLCEVLPDLAAPPRADADTERYALFDAVVALLGVASDITPVVLVLDDLHWAAKPTLLLLRHLLRFGEHARVQIIGAYRSTDLDRSHPLAAMLADLHRDGSDNRLQLRGLDEEDVSAYVAEAGYDDEELARALASVTGGNPFFLIEALRHVDESGGRWDPSTLPQGVREAVSRRLSRLPEETNKALAAAAVVGSRFALDLVERVVGGDLVDAFDEASKAGIVIEEPGGRYRFNHAIVRQSLLAELASVRRMRLHQRIAATLEAESGTDDELLAELAYHYFECAWAGNAAKAVEYCRRAAEQAMSRLAYEGAADLYDRALHALEELDDELPDRDDQQAELLVARCEALLAAGDVASAAGAVSQLQESAGDSARLAAWGVCFDGELSMLTHPERLDQIESSVAEAAEKLAGLDDAAGEAKAHTVRAGCLARLGRIGDCEMALDRALTAARRARDHRRVNAVLAGAPLAALWGPNPVPRAGGRCLDVVRLLRITTGSAVVEATSTRCQGVLDAFRGRPEAGRRLIDSARRTLTELGMRHALLEVDQFAGIVELVADDPAAAEPHLRRAYDGFRRMRLDADTAESAALLARACLALDGDAEADELCTESERLAGHALKASMTWRMVRAQLLARSGNHDAARQVAEQAVAIAARTDALVDHGDACLALATVLSTVGDVAGAQAAAGQAVDLYERKGAAALMEKARRLVGTRDVPTVSPPTEAPIAKLDNACVRVINQMAAASSREAWDEVEKLYAPNVSVESRRKIVGFTQADVPSRDWPRVARHLAEGWAWHRFATIAVRGERLAVTRFELGTDDASPGAPHEEMLQLWGLDEDGRMAMQVFFDVEDIDAAIAELEVIHSRFEEGQRRARAALENSASQVDQRFWTHFPARDWDPMAEILSDDFSLDDRRRAVNAGVRQGRDTEIENLKAMADLADSGNVTCNTIATRGDRLALRVLRFSAQDRQRESYYNEMVGVVEINAENRLASHVVFDPGDLDAAYNELDARYLMGEAGPYAGVWQTVVDTLREANLHELGPIMSELKYVDHRRISFGSNDFGRAVEELWALVPDARYRVTAIHALDAHGTVATLVIEGTDTRGNELQWPRIVALVPDEQRMEVYDEDDLDEALAMFEQLNGPAPRLENTAIRAYERAKERFAIRDWAAIAEILAVDVTTEDRRRVVNAGRREGKDAALAEFFATAEVVNNWMSEVIATRGERLALNRAQIDGADEGPEMFRADVLDVIETNTDGLVVGRVVFDPDDLDAAFAELDARYLAGEAAAHAHTWSLITERHALALSRREIRPPPTDFVNIDHRRGIAFPPGELVPYVSATWNQIPDLSFHVEAVHRLSDFGAVYTLVLKGTSQEGVAAEWRIVEIVTVHGDLINRTEIFDETGLDAALAKFDQLDRPAPRLENEASQVVERYAALFTARDWDTMTDLVAEDFTTDDRRPIVNAGVQLGRDVETASMRAIAEVGVETITTTVIATRGEHLVLYGSTFFAPEWASEEFAVVDVVEINADGQISTHVVFDPGDIDAAFEELESRYLAGEAAAHAHTWSTVAGAYAAFNRREMFPTTPDWVNIDHRRGTPLAAAGDITAAIRAFWDLTPDFSMHVAAVHRLTEFGAVVTHTSNGTSPEGFAAEWRMVQLLTVDGDRINRCEMFDEADLDVALVRFAELSRPPRRLENTAAEITARMQAYYMARDWAGLTRMLADDYYVDDRRRVVSDVLRQGRDAALESMRAMADLGVEHSKFDVIATRGARLVLIRTRWSGHDHRSDDFHTEALAIVEVKANNRMAACVMFDRDDFDAAFEELDARYITGEGAPHAPTWSTITDAYAAINQGEFPTTTPDWVNVDHQLRTTIAAGELTAYLRAGWTLTPGFKIRVAAVHRLTKIAAVVTHSARGISQEGFEAEWSMIAVLTVDGAGIGRCEIFDESDLDAALARCDELSRPIPRLETAATRADDRFAVCFAARDWDALAATMSEDVAIDDRRHVVNAGLRRGRDGEMASVCAMADLGTRSLTSTVIATRGERLLLSRNRFLGRDQRTEAFKTEALCVLEVDTDGRIIARASFDADDLDAAFEELETRYLAGEAAAHAHTWSVITRAYANLNRHEMYPATADLVSIDHRRGAMAFPPGDLIEYIHASWNQIPDLTFRIEAVHQLSNLGAVYTQVLKGTSQDGFTAEWRIVEIMATEGERISHAEIFDESDLDAALTRFDELSWQAPQLENTASQVLEHAWTCFAARDWAAVAETMAEDFTSHDQRRVVNAGVRRGRDVHLTNMRAVAEVGFEKVGSTVVATRGQRLVLSRTSSAVRGLPSEEVGVEAIMIVEIDTDNRLVANSLFDPDNIDSAFEELEARYLAGEAAPHAHTWSLVVAAYTSLNQRKLPATRPDSVNIDHRRLAPIDASGGLSAYLRATWDLSPKSGIYVESVHRLSDLGAVVTQVVNGISQAGFEAEWRMVDLVTFDGELVNRSEQFDEADIGAALARFEELSSPRHGLENAASRMYDRFNAYLVARDWDAMAEMVTDDVCSDDRRRVVSSGIQGGRDAQMANLRAVVDVGAKNHESTVIATRGDRLALTRTRVSGGGRPADAFALEMLTVIEIDTDNRISAGVNFDLDDIDSALEELDARYLAGEAAMHARIWAVIAHTWVGLNRHEVPATTPDWVHVDRRPLPMYEMSELPAYLRATWDLTPQSTTYVEAVHRLTDLGAVLTNASQGTANDGFEVEWRYVCLITFEADLINRAEVFEEANLDDALARFDELNLPATRLENDASRADERFNSLLAVRDWDAMAEVVADEMCNDDRRRLVGAGARHGRDAEIENVRTMVDVGVQSAEPTTIATRGEHLALSRYRISGHGEAAGFVTEILGIVEVDADNRIAARIWFDLDSTDAAFEELDARYVAGEAAAHARTWSLIAQGYAALNRREIPSIAGPVIDKRRLAPLEGVDLKAYIAATLDLTPDITVYIEAVHRLTDRGAVVTHVAKATSPDGADAEWRVVDVYSIGSGRIDRCEMFDDTALDVALARFDELNQQVPQLENAATRIWARLVETFNSRDLNGLIALAAAEACYEDRRRGLRDEGLARPEVARAFFEAAPSGWRMEAEPIAVRGLRFSLTRVRFRDTGDVNRPITTELLALTEVSDGDLIHSSVTFDPDDINGALDELTSRWIASGEAAHPQVIKAHLRILQELNRHDWDAHNASLAGAAYVNHRQLGTGETVTDFATSVTAVASLIPNVWVEPSEILRYSASGVVGDVIAKGTSPAGVEVEIPMVLLSFFEGDRLTRFELFDPDQRDLALARFDELNQA